MDDEDFEPRLGRMRAAGSRRGRKYLHRVLAATALAGGLRRAGRRRFDGSRIGRGAAMARLLGSRDRYAGFRSRRAIVKTRLVRLGGRGLGAARSHLRYIQRDGVTRGGEPGQLYAASEDAADGKAFLERCEGDRHQFRFIVSAEDGAEYPDLKPLTRRFMAQMEGDLGTGLDWVAVDHLDTAHPHTHIMLRGKDDRGENLVIAPDYIKRGMRERLAELVTMDLGPRSDLEIERRQRLEVGSERFTSLDRGLVRDMDSDGIVSAAHRNPLQHALRAGRLRKLAALGLAEETGAAKWRLSPGLEENLRRLGERGDIIRTLQRELGARGLARPASDLAAHDMAPLSGPLVGRVAARGLSDEFRDRHYLIVDGLDGRAHYVEIGAGDAVEPLPEGAIVRVVPVRAEAREVDRIVAEVAAQNAGVYSIEAHMRHDPAATEAFAQAHVRRLEAIRRTVGGIERLGDGSWRVGDDHLARAEAHEAERVREAPVRVELLSPLPLPALPETEGATWLDRELLAESPEPLRDSGFGREVRSALAARRQWLLAQGLAHEAEGGTVYAGALVERLRRQDLLRAAQGLSEELGLAYRHVETGPADGRLMRRLDLASGRFALLAGAREFSLVPWRDGMDRRIGRELAVQVRGSAVSWRLGRERAGPEIG
ncbi:MAG TPA: relaxase/mobilization nuclease RlxS [Allosphingosinicella sp.]|nr:relaxase/mobilization nuclease RlxS [Allosphingosinicella sp.]